ncbi:MAG: AAA family ATPase [Candidatus Omnitrophota bacterium]
MSYYKVLGLEKEPFSTSPDPLFFYESNEHRSAITRVLIELSLRRGLSVILGDVGTGKTTLSRKLFQILKEKENVIFHMLLDPTYASEDMFLSSLLKAFQIDTDGEGLNIVECKEAVEKFLFKKGVEENKTVVLLIDEAQKLNEMSLEVLRVLLNYETNEYKLLQLVLLGQMELFPKIKKMRNLWDRISLKYVINPLDEQETSKMIDFRIQQASFNPQRELFTDEAKQEIYKHTQGYPRRISMLCHSALRTLVISKKTLVDKEIVKDVVYQEVV